MNERQKQTVFLKRLLEREAVDQKRQLQARIAKAECDEKCVRTAMSLVGIAGLLCVCGICYEAVFVEDFFVNPTHLLTRLLGYLGLGSGLCWVVFLGYWLWHRALTNRLYEECRRLVITLKDQQTAPTSLSECSTTPLLVVPKRDTGHDTHHLPLPKAA